jgi:hypothetical protein
MWGICFFERGRRIARLSLHKKMIFFPPVCPSVHLETSTATYFCGNIREYVIPSSYHHTNNKQHQQHQQQQQKQQKQQHQASKLRSLTVVNRSNSNNVNCYDNKLEDPQSKTLFLRPRQKFASQANQATNSMGRDKQYFSGAKVPLLEFSTSKAMCYVTASRVMFVKTGICFQTNLFDYSVVEFTTSVSSKSKRRVVDIVISDTDAVFQF